MFKTILSGLLLLGLTLGASANEDPAAFAKRYQAALSKATTFKDMASFYTKSAADNLQGRADAPLDFPGHQTFAELQNLQTDLKVDNAHAEAEKADVNLSGLSHDHRFKLELDLHLLSTPAGWRIDTMETDSEDLTQK